MRLFNHIARRYVSSSLASVFNKIQPAPTGILSQFTLLNKPHQTGLFGYDVLGEPTGFNLLRENAIKNAERLVQTAINNERKEKMVSVFDQLSNCLCKVADMAEFVRINHPVARYRAAAEDASMTISAEVEKLNTNKQLYLALKNVVDTGKDVLPTTDLDRQVARLFLIDFEQSGIHLDDKFRKIAVNLNEFIFQLSSAFMCNSQTPRTVLQTQLPKHLQNCFPIEGNQIIINNFYSSSDDEQIREVAYRLYLQVDEHQENLLRELILARKKLATLCGFNSYSERAVRGSIIDNPGIIWQFLNKVSDELKPLVKQDYETMLKIKQATTSNSKTTLQPWDVPYLTALYKEKKFSKCIASAAPYFSLGSCMEGINLIISELFDIKFIVAETKTGELWSKDVIKLNVIDKSSNNLLGSIYCDFFERSGKPNQDCHFTIQGGCELENGKYQEPIVVLCLNLSKGPPTLLTPHSVDNLFHEMGHAIHSMLARTPYQHITGTRCSTDLAEVPSILMENFASDARVIKLFAKHYKTGETIPDSLSEDWINSKKCFLASETQLQVFYSIFDQIFHSSDPLMGKQCTSDVLAEVQSKYYDLPFIKNTAWQLRFGHLVGYGAKYYSYLVSRAVSRLIWSKLFNENPLSKDAGKRYYDQVLSHGGGKSPKLIIQDVLGIEEVNAEFLSKSLIDEIVVSLK